MATEKPNPFATVAARTESAKTTGRGRRTPATAETDTNESAVTRSPVTGKVTPKRTAKTHRLGDPAIERIEEVVNSFAERGIRITRDEVVQRALLGYWTPKRVNGE
ncbi:hypothetical protein [Rathayibacter rathayi]|uniref:hypothetical protein n=1 Tax=Rathayibacter rathayi TaxID=33887 RepID=UPI000CE7570C|nr:hypothetical protein [Rathayibacter rathayi]PPH29277.1 hypothetical protein C5C28_14965 [Rathayibacter rathayi]